MEQALYRIADLVACAPSEDDDTQGLMPFAWDIDRDTELGRQLSRRAAEKLPKGLDDVHEVAIALIINDIAVWAQEGYEKGDLLRLLVESVIGALSFEMATQDFCDMMIEDYIGEDDLPAGVVIQSFAAVAGGLYASVANQDNLPEDLPEDSWRALGHVMVREALLHGTPGTKDWDTLVAANDETQQDVYKCMESIEVEVTDFFDVIGLENPLAQAVALAKAVGRMVALVCVEDVGQTHPSIAKSLAKTGMILGFRQRVPTH